MKFSNFIVVGTQRSGTSFFASSLGQHPQIACGWEWALYLPYFKKLSVINRALSCNFTELKKNDREHMESCKKKYTHLGFRLLFSSSPLWFINPYFNLAHKKERMVGFIRYIQRHPYIKILHIYRNDNMAWLTSLYMAKQANLYVDKPYPKNMTISIPPQKAKKRVIAKNYIYNSLAKLSDTNPYYEFSYENLISNPEKIYFESYNFLSVESKFLPKEMMKKQQTRSIKDVLENYEEIQKILAR